VWDSVFGRFSGLEEREHALVQILQSASSASDRVVRGVRVHRQEEFSGNTPSLLDFVCPEAVEELGVIRTPGLRLQIASAAARNNDVGELPHVCRDDSGFADTLTQTDLAFDCLRVSLDDRDGFQPPRKSHQTSWRELRRAFQTTVDDVILACVRTNNYDRAVELLANESVAHGVSGKALIRLIHALIAQKRFGQAQTVLALNRRNGPFISVLGHGKLIQLVGELTPEELPEYASPKQRQSLQDSVRLVGVLLSEINRKGAKIRSFAAQRSLAQLLAFTGHLKESKGILVNMLTQAPKEVPVEVVHKHVKLALDRVGIALSRSSHSNFAEMLQWVAELNAFGLPSAGPLFIADIARVIATHGELRQSMSLIDGLYERGQFVPATTLQKIVKCCGIGETHDMGPPGSPQRFEYRQGLLRLVQRLPESYVEQDPQCIAALVCAWTETSLDSTDRSHVSASIGMAVVRVAEEWAAMHMADQARGCTPGTVTQLISHCSDAEEILEVIHAMSNLRDTSGSAERRFELLDSAVEDEHISALFSRVAKVEVPPTMITCQHMATRKLQEWCVRAGIPVMQSSAGQLRPVSKTDMTKQLSLLETQQKLLSLGSEQEADLHPLAREMWEERLAVALGEMAVPEHGDTLVGEPEHDDTAEGAPTS
jgi:hypothetical protein